MNKDEFHEKLKDPEMAAVRESVTTIVSNPKNAIEKVVYDHKAIDSDEIIVTIQMVVPGLGAQRYPKTK